MLILVDGAVNYKEYKDMLKQQKNDQPLMVESSSDDKKREQFALFDKNNDGMISSMEVHEVLSTLNLARELEEEDIDHQVQEIMRRHDSDGDGILTLAGLYTELHIWIE